MDRLGMGADEQAQIAQVLDHPRRDHPRHRPYGLRPRAPPSTPSCTRSTRPSCAIITSIEDPIEYEVPGANQMQVRSEIGLTFASALRHVLRQDPDVIMVGEDS